MSYIISEETGTTAADTLPRVECAPWCEDGDGHPAARHPEDQYCTTAAVRVGLSRYPLVRLVGEGWARDDLRVYLMRERFAAEAHVSIARGELAAADLSLEEAEQTAHALLEVVRQARA